MIIDIDDLFEVISELEPATSKWKKIGLALRLRPDQLNVIETEQKTADWSLTEVLTLWLRKSYNTERFGGPSWEQLVQVVSHRSGANDPALAEKIANKHKDEIPKEMSP